MCLCSGNDRICSICYLTDVGEDEPAFAVVPRSFQKEPIGQAKVDLSDSYTEQPLYGPAGTCVSCASPVGTDQIV